MRTILTIHSRNRYIYVWLKHEIGIKQERRYYIGQRKGKSGYNKKINKANSIQK